MKARQPTEYQNGIIDIFKLNRILDLNVNDCQKKGDVSCSMDNQIGRKIIKVSGSLGPSNFLAIPNGKNSKGLNYYGKNYYIFCKSFEDKKFSIQMTFNFNDLEIIRFIFKHTLKQMKITRTNTYNIEIPLNIDQSKNEIWTLYKFNPVEIISNLIPENKDFNSLKGITIDTLILKSIEIFSTIYVRGIYISNYDITTDYLPKEMSVKTLNNRNCCDLLFEDINKQFSLKNNSSQNNIKKITKANNIKKREEDSLERAIEDMARERDLLLKNKNKENLFNYNESTIKKIEEDNILQQKDFKCSDDFNDLSKGLLDSNMNKINKEFNELKKEANKNSQKKEIQKIPLLPDPMMNLNYIIGYTANNCPFVLYNSYGDYYLNQNLKKEQNIHETKKFIYFCSGPNLIKFDPVNLQQKFFIGHSKPISQFIIACKGEIIFSNQEGTNSIIRIWKTETGNCIKMLTTPFDKLKKMTENKSSRLLCTIGSEQNKESIIIWNIENLEDINVFIRQTVPTNINTLKFSPYEENILVSCGKESIKFWRIKNDHLSGKAVVLNQYCRDNEFLCLDFSKSMLGDDFTDKGKLYVGSAKGCVYIVSCNNQELESVYKVQDSAILSLAMNEAFCATGSEDGHLRVWPIDFSEFLIEAKHDKSICSVDISYDGLEVLCGTLGGSIGLLNMENKEYKTILRSPPNSIKQIVVHPSGNYLFTIESDNSVRIWDIDHKAEAFQFLSSKDPPYSVCSPQSLNFVCGFKSGIIKVFDIEKTEILYECKPFKSPVNNLLFIQKDKFLISMSDQGNMSIHDTNNNYIQVKLIDIDQPAVFTDLSLAIEEDYFASIGSESNCALVWNCETFGMKNRIPINNFLIKKLCIINKNLIAIVLNNCNIRFYVLGEYEGIFIKELSNLHINNINQIITSNNYKYILTSGDEGMIKIWDMKMIFKNIQSYQQYIGHSSGVKGLVLLEKKGVIISTGEQSGIYFWNFSGDLTFTESEIIKELEKLNDVDYIKSLSQKKCHNTTIIGKTILTKGNNSNTINNSKNKKNILTKDLRTQHLDKIYKTENNPENIGQTKFINNNNNLNEEYKVNESEFKLLPTLLEDKDELNISYANNELNINQAIINKYDTTNIQPDNPKNEAIMNKLLYHTKYLPDKQNKFKDPDTTSKKLKLKYCLGLSVNSMNNLVFNKENKWYAYTVNNKVIIEFLDNERKEIILTESKDELSCLLLSPDGNYLVAAVGCVNKEEYAPIYIYNTNDFVLYKKLNFHFKGIQYIAISQNCQYMISIGCNEEKSICVWNFSKFSVIDSKSLKFCPFMAICEERNDNNIYFISASQYVLSFWKINESLKLEGYHLNFEDISNQKIKGEYITGLCLTPYINSNKGSYVILSTNRGNVMIISKEQKILIKKYMISKFAITKILYINNNFICGGEGPLLYSWKIDLNKNNLDNALGVFEKEKPSLLFIDSALNSISISNSGDEGLLCTDNGSIFFLNFAEKAAFKIISSHINCNITSLDCDVNNQNLISCGQDGGVRCWTMDSFDQKFLLQKLNQVPDNAIINQRENISIILFDSSYLSLYSLKNMRSIGKIQIPNEDIKFYELIFNNTALLIMTNSYNLYIVDIKTWEPLNTLFTQLKINKKIIPTNQSCQSLKTNSISNDKAYATISFSEGTVLTFFLEKEKEKVLINLIDSFNILELYMKNTKDENMKEMINNINNYRNEYKTCSVFSNQFDGLLLCFHESLQFIFIRNFLKNDLIKSIPLNYFPYSLALSDDEKYIGVGTKEGIILIITREDESYEKYFNIDIVKEHYDSVNCLKFSHAGNKLFSTSYNELYIWSIKI